MHKICFGFKTSYLLSAKYRLRFATQEELTSKFKEFLYNHAGPELVIHSDPQGLPNYVQAVILREISNPVNKTPIIKLETTKNFFTEENQATLAEYLLINKTRCTELRLKKRRRAELHREWVFSRMGMMLGLGGFCILNGLSYTPISALMCCLSTAVGYFVGSNIAESRSMQLAASARRYDNIEKISQITNDEEALALELGVKSLTWRPYLANLNDAVANAFPDAFRAGLTHGMDDNTSLTNQITARAKM